MKRSRLCYLAIAVLALGMDPTHAADTRPRRKSDAAEIRKLQKEIVQRDALIRNLLRRVERIERRDGMTGEPSRRRGVAAKAQPRRKVAASATAPSAQLNEPQSPPSPAGAAAAQSGQTSPEAAATPAAAPGQFEVSPEAAQHALERALIETGALLLPPGKFQIVPSVTYQYQQATRAAGLALTTSGTVLVTQDLLRAETVQAQALLRAGLPWDAQLEFALPYAFKSDSTTLQAGGSDISNQIVDAAGIGDATLTLTKQVLKEGDWLPNLFLSGSWNADIGQTVKGVPLGMGFTEFRGAVLASKRQDPLVFTAGFTYQASLEKNGIEPGDQFIPAVGMLFAVSPETSLQFSQQIAFVENTQLHGLTVPGSSQLQGIFNAGVLSILAPGVVVNLTAAIGETPDAPALTVQLAFPIQLN